MTDNAPRAARRELVKAIDVLLRRLEKRTSFEAADRKRLHREAQARKRAAELHDRALRQLQERQERAEAALARELNRLNERHVLMDSQDLADQRRRLRSAGEEAHRLAESARTEFAQSHAAALDGLVTRHRQEAEHAAKRRAEFDAVTEQAHELREQLSAHIRRHGDLGRRLRRAQTRALRRIPNEEQQ